MHCSKLEIVNGFHGKDALQCCWLIQFTMMCIGFACIHRRVCDDGRPTIVRCVISSIIRNERTNRTEQMKWNFCGWRTQKKTHAHHLCLSIFLLQLRFNYFVKYGLCWNAVHALNPLICAHRSNAIQTNIHFHTSHANATNRPWFIFISLALGTCHFICSIAENLAKCYDGCHIFFSFWL